MWIPSYVAISSIKSSSQLLKKISTTIQTTPPTINPTTVPTLGQIAEPNAVAPYKMPLFK